MLNAYSYARRLLIIVMQCKMFKKIVEFSTLTTATGINCKLVPVGTYIFLQSTGITQRQKIYENILIILVGMSGNKPSGAQHSFCKLSADALVHARVHK